ncbi:hypothetical protein VNO77_02939 [Canavalia gladiata]|uniref:Uncharacterized protein n=1 Tax=Canavalia gladiata TaxID=3824 RepID=A0AAN9R6I4_CANGL
MAEVPRFIIWISLLTVVDGGGYFPSLFPVPGNNTFPIISLAHPSSRPCWNFLSITSSFPSPLWRRQLLEQLPSSRSNHKSPNLTQTLNLTLQPFLESEKPMS